MNAKQPTLDDAPADAGVPFDDETVDAVVHEDEIATPVVVEPDRPPAPVGSRGELARHVAGGVTADALDVAKRLGEGLARTEFVPKAMRNNPAAVMAAILTGRELGVDAMASLREITIIQGRPNLSASLQLGMVRRAGHRVEGTADAKRAELVGTRGDTGETITVVWTLEDAARAGLATITDEGTARARSSTGSPLPWESYTQAMLWARAATELCRRLFSDVILFGVDPDIGDLE